MPFAKKPQVFSAKINELTLGTGDKATVLGGQNVFNLYSFDAPIANRPKIGIDVSDDPEQPSEGLKAFYAGCDTLAQRAKKAAELEDVDLALALQNFSWSYYCYSSALKVGTQLLSQSLIDYMT